MKVPVRAKRSKVEMQQEFAEIQEQVESARDAADAKAEGAARLRAAEVRQAPESITVEAVVRSARMERERKEQDETLKKQRQREIEDYEYKKALERKKAQDKYEEEMRLVEKKNQERQEALEKGWRQREAELKEREDELTHLRKEVEGFPARLQNEAETAALRVRRETEAKFEQEVLVLKKDAETEKRLAELHVRTLEETLARQAAQIVTLEKQLVEAKQQVQDIAVKAIEGASGSKALSHVNQIAMEQAKNRRQG